MLHKHWYMLVVISGEEIHHATEAGKSYTDTAGWRPADDLPLLINIHLTPHPLQRNRGHIS
jgi:hypothetical protein